MGQTQIDGRQIMSNDITNAEIADGTIRGATGNAGAQQEIAFGTISTPDLRTAAVTPVKIDSTQSYTMAAETLTNTSNQLILGAGTTITLTAPTPVASRIYTLPDVGGSSSFIMDQGTQTINGSKTFSSALNVGVNEGINVNSGGGSSGWIDFYNASGQYRISLSGSSIQTTVGANGTLNVGIGSLTVSPFSSPSWTFNNGGLGTSSGTIHIADGTAGSPSYTFNSDQTTGMYKSGTDILSFATAGLIAFSANASQQLDMNSHKIVNLLDPTVAQDAATKNYVDAHTVSFPILAPDGTAAAPTYSFSADSDIGVFRAGTDILSFATNAIEAIRVDATQGLDFLQHQAKQMVVHLLATDPGSPVEGQIWYNTTTHQWVGYNGTSNVVLG